MAKLILSLLLIFSLSGCASQLNNDWLHDLVSSAEQPAQFNFDWQLSGDPALLPLQVFDNGKKLWLQYPENTVVPALFARSAAGDIFLTPKREGDFLVLKDIPDEIVIHGGIQKAQIKRKAAVAINQSVKEQIAQIYALDKPKELVTTKKSITKNPTISSADTGAKPLLVAQANSNKSASQTVKNLNKSIGAASGLPKLSPIPKEYSVSPSDINIRHALKLWSNNSEWTFNDEHWSVDVDIPIAGSASFGNSFQLAVRDLLEATELGDRPLQPCFYSNKVLRVVPMAQRCDRTNNLGVSL